MNKPDPTCEAVRIVILGASISSMLAANTSDNSDYALTFFALSMLLLSAYGIMEHIKIYSK